MAGIMDWLFGSGPEQQKLPTGTEAQMQFGGNDLIKYLQQMLAPGGGFNAANQFDLNLLGNPQEAFNQFSNPYMQQFEQQILPQLAEKYAGAGALSSSGFGQAIGGAASNLQAQLAQLFSGLQSQAAGRQQGQFQNLAQTGLGYSPFAYHEKPGSEGFLPNLLGGIAGAAAGPLGGAIGNLAGSGITSLFKTAPKGGIA